MKYELSKFNDVYFFYTQIALSELENEFRQLRITDVVKQFQEF